MMNAVTHAIANSLRRAVTIVTAAILFHTRVSGSSLLGIVLVIGGSVMYTLAKSTTRAQAHNLSGMLVSTLIACNPFA